MNIEDILLRALTGATNEVRNNALNAINQWLASNPDEFVNGLAGILVGTGKDPGIQQLACTQLKQIFTVQSSPDQGAAVTRWWSMSDQTRVNVKNALFNSLQIPMVGMVAAVAIAPIALIELSKGQWLDLIQAFTKVGMSSEFPPSTVIATLACIGFLVEQASLNAKSILTVETVNALLTVLVYRMGPTPGIDPNSRESIEIRAQATQAMYHLIDYTTSNFSNESERYMIMKAVLTNSTVPTDPLIKKFAFRSLERVVRKQYNYLSCKVPTDLATPANGLSEIIELILTVTFNQVDSVVQNVLSSGAYLYGGEPEGDCAIDAVNVWRSLATYEYELKCTQNPGNVQNHACNNYIQRALGTLVPKLLMGMCTQVENQELDVFNVSTISGVALRECARTTGGLIVQPIMTFVNANVSNENWRLADTSCLAFGIVVEYGDEIVDSYVPDATKFFIEKSLKHPVLVVRESAAWALGMICKYKFLVLFKSGLINNLINAFSVCFADDTRVVANVCTAIYNMAYAAADNGKACGFENDEHALSGITKDIIAALLKAIQRPDANNQHFLTNAYECINSLVINAPNSLLNVVEDLLLEIAKGMTLIVAQITDANNGNGASMQNNMLETSLALMCGTLNTIISRLADNARELLMKYNMSIAELLIRKIIFSNVVSSNVTVVEEAILALDALVLGAEGECFQYSIEGLKIAIEVLKHPEHGDTFGVGVGLAGDIVAAVGDSSYEAKNRDLYAGVVQCTDNVIVLIKNAVDAICSSGGKMVHFTLNALINALPQFITVNSKQFLGKYLEPIMSCLSSLTVFCMQHNSEEDNILSGEEYYETDIVNGEFETNHSRIQYSILTAWGCVVSCVIDESNVYGEKLVPLLNIMISFIESCYNNGKCTKRILLNAITLASDIVYFNPNLARQYLGSKPWFRTMVNFAQNIYTEPRDIQSLTTSMQVFSHARLFG